MGDGPLNGRPLLHIDALYKEYDNPATLVLDKIGFDLFAEDFLCILGPSGCGKSTLIRCIAGFERYEGTIEIDGKGVTGPGFDRIMVFQEFNQLFPWKTVIKNIMYALKINGIKDREEARGRAELYLEKVGLIDYRDYYPHQLSGGMKQRVAIARAMALKPRIVLMDEPFAALDAMSRNQMQDELLRIKEGEGMTVLFITHNIQEAISLGNRIMVMGRKGNIRESMDNPLKKPITPASEGYSEMWRHLNQMLRDGS